MKKSYKLNLKGISKETLIRTALLLLALINELLTVFGKSLIPVSDEELSTLIGTAFTVVTALVAYWKNNSITAEAQEADVYLEAVRAGEAVKGEM